MTGTPELPDGIWRRDTITGGFRDWRAEQRVLTEPDQFRTLIETGIDEIVWYPPDGARIPMWPAMVLRDIVKTHGTRWVGGLGVSPVPLEFPEDGHLHGYLDHGTEPMWATYSVLAVRYMTRDGWQIPHYLDKGMECVAVDTITVHRPPGLSLACALNRHTECTGFSRLREEQRPCPCDCGCRSRRSGSDTSSQQLTEEQDDLKPDGQAGTITHNKPPETE